jgi:hypothetical protein
LASILLVYGISSLGIQKANAQLPPSESILSADAKGWISFPDYATMSKRFETTQWGIIFQDPKLKPFEEQLRDYFNEQLSVSERQLGVRIDDLRGVATGEISSAAFQWGAENAPQRGFTLLVDTTGNRQAADALVAKVAAALAKKGGQIQRGPFKNGNVTKVTIKDRNNVAHTIEYFVNARMLLATNSHLLLDDVLKRVGLPNDQTSLSRSERFQTVEKKLSAALPLLDPDVDWYVIPLDYAAIIRDASESPSRRRRDKIKVLRRQGFDALEAVGGRMGFAQQNRDATSVTFVLSPKNKRTKAALALTFPPHPALPADEWISESAGAAAEISWDLPTAFANLKGLVDDWLNQEGYAEAVLGEMAIDPKGLEIDIEKQVIAQTKGRISVSREVILPVTKTSEKILVGVPLVDPNKLYKLLDQRLKRDPSIRIHDLKSGRRVWELPPGKKKSDRPNSGFGKGAPAPKPKRVVAAAVNPGITIHKGRFFYCNDWNHLVKFVESDWTKIKKLTADPDYIRVSKELDRVAAKEMGGISVSQFRRLAEAYRINFELARQNKVGESDTIILRLIRSLLTQDEEEDDTKSESKKIDGTKLPPFNAIEKNLGFSGYRVYTRDDGWMIYSVVLPKQVLPKIEAQGM